MSTIKKIIKGYSGLLVKGSKTFASIIKIVIFLLFVFTVSIVIVYPLWYMANKSPELYSIFVGITVAVIFLAYIIYKFINIVKNEGLKLYFKEKAFPFIIKIFSFLLVFSSILLTIFIFTTSIILGSILALLLLLALGYIKFVYKN